ADPTSSSAAPSDSAFTGQHAPLDARPAGLSEREIEVLRMVARGASNPEIATGLCITVNTVKVHLRNILDKLQLHNRTQAATFALQSGLVAPDFALAV
ncbi:MAG: response regulator transcription factor, partial [Anaerolineales bacterium]